MQDETGKESTTLAGSAIRKADMVPGNVRGKPPFRTPRRN
jgi:hypothetical protein